MQHLRPLEDIIISKFYLSIEFGRRSGLYSARRFFNLSVMKYFFPIITIIGLNLFSCKGIETTTTDFTPEHLFTKGIEGPAVNSKNELFVVNFREEGTIGKLNMKGKAELFVKLPEGSIGNGIRFDRNDNMYIADYKGHNVLLIKNDTRDVKIFAHEPKANQPNDLAINKEGMLFASDPDWKNGTGNIWRVDQKGFHLLESGMGTTNGIEVSPGGEYLYVNESVQRKIWRYDLDKEGNISNKTLFYTFKDFGLDGMRCDTKGNLYVCRYGAGKVVVLDPGGTLIRTIHLKGEKPTNIAFGGKNRKRCFVTLQDRGSIETFKAEYPGKDF